MTDFLADELFLKYRYNEWCRQDTVCPCRRRVCGHCVSVMYVLWRTHSVRTVCIMADTQCPIPTRLQ
jgi:hypothetical protein